MKQKEFFVFFGGKTLFNLPISGLILRPSNRARKFASRRRTRLEKPARIVGLGVSDAGF
jgi:hypothetical protein